MLCHICVKKFVMSSNVLGRSVQCERLSTVLIMVRAERVEQGEVGWYMHPKGENKHGCVRVWL